jgi:hypothetical protein
VARCVAAKVDGLIGSGPKGGGHLQRALAGALLVAGAATLAQANPRRAAGEAARYLAITASQQAQIDATVQSWKAELQVLHGSDAAGLSAAQKAALCTRSKQRLAHHIDQARAVLTAEQTRRLAVLQQAFDLLTVVESAQAALLLPERLSAAPAGLPDGQLSNEFVFKRQLALPLPGCPTQAQQVLPEVNGPVQNSPGAKPKK